MADFLDQGFMNSISTTCFPDLCQSRGRSTCVVTLTSSPLQGQSLNLILLKVPVSQWGKIKITKNKQKTENKQTNKAFMQGAASWSLAPVNSGEICWQAAASCLDKSKKYIKAKGTRSVIATSTLCGLTKLHYFSVLFFPSKFPRKADLLYRNEGDTQAALWAG